MRGVLLAAVAALLAASIPVAHASAPPVVLSAQLLLDRMVDPVAGMRPLPAGVRVISHSSHDRAGGNNDAVSSPGGYVAFAEDRPGCVTRMWMTDLLVTGGAPNGSLASVGNLQFFFDGETRPRIDIPAPRLFSGGAPGFPVPLVGNYAVSSGGDYSYVPICFKTSMEIRATAGPAGVDYYQFEALVAPWGSAVDESAPPRLAAAAAALRHAGAAPSAPPAATASGRGRAAVELGGSGIVTYVGVTIHPFDIATLQATRLTITADGAAVDVPLGDAFGDGIETRPIRSAAFGMTPSTSSGYFALPAPFGAGATVAVQSSRPADIQLAVWAAAPDPSIGAVRLVGRHTEETTTIGRDFTVLDDGARGRLAAWVLDLTGQPTSGTAQTFMEGDDRVRVDGSRSPTVYGTGTEDAFNGGFYYANGAFTLPTHGAGPLSSVPIDVGRQSQYRVFAADGPRWERGIQFTMEHGGSDEAVTGAANTVFFYGRAGDLAVTDAAAHDLAGTHRDTTLTAYFEGPHDGTFRPPLVPVGLLSDIAVPSQLSSDAVTASGISFTSPVSFTVTSSRANCGVVLRRLLDSATPSRVMVSDNGHPIGVWAVLEANSSKRWKEDDFELPAAATAGIDRQRITLSPLGAAAETMYGLTVLSRAC